MPTYRVEGRLVTYWAPIEPETQSEWQTVDLQVTADSPHEARQKAAQKMIDDDPAKEAEAWDFVDCDDSKLKVREISGAELAEMRLSKEQAKFREEIAAHAVGTLFEMA